ncbi:MAG TPA: hypothetical protein VFR96_19125 [Povalibacter sp.]|jgi:hypothetical protein|nr:hypothetical protein [Povalibacter sp.]
MRAFLIAVGVLSWVMALAVMVIFAASGGVLTAIASGIFAVVAVVALGCERIIKTLEDIRDAPARARLNTVPISALPAAPL